MATQATGLPVEVTAREIRAGDRACIEVLSVNWIGTTVEVKLDNGTSHLVSPDQRFTVLRAR